MGTIAAFLTAATAAMRAFPLWLAWRQSEELEKLTDEIIDLEARARPDERPRLDRLRVKLANARKHHAALLAIVTPPESRNEGRDDSRNIRSTGR
jgi:uncharacterized protein with von Willebrand factor type A (vWA) domain